MTQALRSPHWIPFRSSRSQNSLYDAQYGRGADANVDVETKSGTSEFHGNVYYFGRNKALDANNFFANATGVWLACTMTLVSASSTRIVSLAVSIGGYIGKQAGPMGSKDL